MRRDAGTGLARRGQPVEQADRPVGGVEDRPALRDRGLAEDIVEQRERALLGGMRMRLAAEAGKPCTQGRPLPFQVAVLASEIDLDVQRERWMGAGTGGLAHCLQSMPPEVRTIRPEHSESKGFLCCDNVMARAVAGGSHATHATRRLHGRARHDVK